MAKKIFKNKLAVSAIILFASFFIVFGIAKLNGFNAASSAATSLQWTQNTGAGISVPACSSSSTSGTCSGGTALVNINWGSSPHGGTLCGRGIITCFLSIDGVNFGQINGSSYTWSGAPNTFHTYQVKFFDSSATGGANGFIFNPVYAQQLAGVEDGSFSAPNCVLPPPPPPPPTASISASPSTINFGQSSTLSWSSTNATSCSINQGIGGVGTSGSRSVSPTNSTTYTLSCSGAGGSASASATVTVIPGNFTLSLNGSTSCNSVPLSWTASGGASAYRILRGSPRVDISPYQPYSAQNFTDTTVSQNTTYPYQIEAYNSGGTNRSNTINVTTPYCPPSLSFSGTPTSVFEGQSTTLTWSSAFTSSCIASSAPSQSGWNGSKSLSGSQIVVPLPPPAVTYNLQCSGPGGSTPLQPVIVNITSLALPEFKEIIPR